jgi:hypothetical protein
MPRSIVAARKRSHKSLKSDTNEVFALTDEIIYIDKQRGELERTILMLEETLQQWDKLIDRLDRRRDYLRQENRTHNQK